MRLGATIRFGGLAMPAATVLLLGGCWLSHGDDDGPPGAASGGDADADGDTDADADADADADPLDGLDRLRPALVCGMPGVDRRGGGSLRILVYDCVAGASCDAVVAGGAVDLRPRGRLGECQSSVHWIDCAVPAGDFRALTVWGEPVFTECFGGDEGDCGPGPDCTELPPAPLPEGCAIGPLMGNSLCSPPIVPAADRGEVRAANDCACGADYRVAGCWIDEREGGLSVRPLIAQCSECAQEDYCQTVEASCTLFDLAAGAVTITLGEAMCREAPAVTIEARPGGGGSSEPDCSSCF